MTFVEGYQKRFNVEAYQGVVTYLVEAYQGIATQLTGLNQACQPGNTPRWVRGRVSQPLKKYKKCRSVDYRNRTPDRVIAGPNLSAARQKVKHKKRPPRGTRAVSNICEFSAFVT